ncbi:hypothetical protein DFJ73DRAFT_783068 [Zopfochytrium polystomum]|nr:hypothetical protein DFJ73DRAFT_783068 [Zopfochytrium polystomum]
MLESRLINLHPVWARECLEHIRSETQATMTTLALCDKIQEYFVLTPLRDSAAGPVLPANVEEAHEEVVGSRRPGGQHGCILEIESIIDVGVSAWKFVDQLAKEGTKAAVEFRKPGEPDPVQKAIDTLPRSMLKLTLTDGYHSIPAMEYQPLRFLSLKTPLGTKLVVKDATIRRGVLYLTPENVRVLGLGYEETPEVLADRLLQLFGDTVLDRKDSVHLYPANEPAEPAEPAPEFKDDFGGGGEPVRWSRAREGCKRRTRHGEKTSGRSCHNAGSSRDGDPRSSGQIVAARPHPNPYRPPAIGVQQAAPVEDDEFDFGEDEQELLAALDEAEGRMDNREPYNPEPPPTSRFEARGHLSKPIVKDLKPEILVEDTPAFDLTQPESEVFSLDFGILSKHRSR